MIKINLCNNRGKTKQSFPGVRKIVQKVRRVVGKLTGTRNKAVQGRNFIKDA